MSKTFQEHVYNAKAMSNHSVANPAHTRLVTYVFTTHCLNYMKVTNPCNVMEYRWSHTLNNIGNPYPKYVCMNRMHNEYALIMK